MSRLPLAKSSNQNKETLFRERFCNERLEKVKQLAKRYPTILCIGSKKLGALLEEAGLNVTFTEAQLPWGKLEERRFDLILAFDVIATLHPKEYRLALSEFERLLALKGRVLISTPLDVYAEDARLRFQQLVETEFKIEESFFEYAAPLIRLGKLIPFFAFLAQSKVLQRMVKLLWQEEGISYVEYLALRRAITEEREPPLPDRAPFIKQVEWQ